MKETNSTQTLFGEYLDLLEITCPLIRALIAAPCWEICGGNAICYIGSHILQHFEFDYESVFLNHLVSFIRHSEITYIESHCIQYVFLPFCLHLSPKLNVLYLTVFVKKYKKKYLY